MRSAKLSGLSIEALLQQVRENREGAWEELLRRSETQLEAWAENRIRRFTLGGIRPSDVAQEAAMSAFERFSSFRGTGEGQWHDWLKQVLDSRWVDMLRKAGTQKRDDAEVLPLDAPEAEVAPALQPSPSQTTSQKEVSLRLLTYCHELPDAQREAVSLLYYHDEDAADVARRMGCSREAVHSLRQRALRTLRARMNGQEEVAPEETPQTALLRNRVDAALALYFRRWEEGTRLDPDTFAADYPDCADELRSLLHWVERLRFLLSPSSA